MLFIVLNLQPKMTTRLLAVPKSTFPCLRSNLFVVVLAGLLVSAALPALAANVLVEGGVQGLSVGPRLTGLGHTVTISDGATWNSSFDYSPYDVVAFEFSSGDPADIAHLVAAVDAGQVGVVFFRRVDIRL